MKIILYILILSSLIFSEQKPKLTDVIDYVKIVDDSLEIKVKQDVVRHVSFTSNPGNLYHNPAEIDKNIIKTNEKRRYYNKIDRIDLRHSNFKFNYHFYTEKSYLEDIYPELIKQPRFNGLVDSLQQFYKFVYFITNDISTDYKYVDTLWIDNERPIKIRNKVNVPLTRKLSGHIYCIKNTKISQKRIRYIQRIVERDYGYKIIEDKYALIIKLPIRKMKILPIADPTSFADYYFNYDVAVERNPLMKECKKNTNRSKSTLELFLDAGNPEE